MTRRTWPLLALLACLWTAVCPADGRGVGPVNLQQVVRETERQFALSMAKRDFAGFQTFLADETVFFHGDREADRGKAAVAARWRAFFNTPEAPFSWEPDTVEVLDSGTLALSSGPVHDADGRLVGRFNSIWRREADGHWRVVFDKGSAVCDQIGD